MLDEQSNKTKCQTPSLRRRRSSAEVLNHLRDFLASRASMDLMSRQTHADFVLRVGLEQAVEEQMPHFQAHKDATVTCIRLLGRVDHIHISECRVH